MTNNLSSYKRLCIFWKILGVCPLGLNYDGTFHHSNCNACYAPLLTVTFTVLIADEILTRLSCIMPGETLISVVFGILSTVLEYGVIFGAWLNVGLRQNLVNHIVETFKRIRVHISSLEIPMDMDNKALRHIKLRTFLINVTWLCLYLLGNCSSLRYPCFDYRIRMPANLPRMVTHNVLAIFVYAMRFSNSSFLTLNASINRGLRRTERATYMKDDEAIVLESYEKFSEIDLIKIGEIHEDLNSLVNMVTDFLSLPIMLNLCVNYIQISSSLYSFCVLVNNLQFQSWADVIIFTKWISWLVVHSVELLVTINVCDTVTREANRSANILHKIFLSDCFENYKQQIKLSLKLLQHPLQVKLHGLHLNSALLITIFGSITTYVVVMMQLDEQAREVSMNSINRVSI